MSYLRQNRYDIGGIPIFICTQRSGGSVNGWLRGTPIRVSLLSKFEVI